MFVFCFSDKEQKRTVTRMFHRCSETRDIISGIQENEERETEVQNNTAQSLPSFRFNPVHCRTLAWLWSSHWFVTLETDFPPTNCVPSTGEAGRGALKNKPCHMNLLRLCDRGKKQGFQMQATGEIKLETSCFFLKKDWGL